jgi:hypothetical protein
VPRWSLEHTRQNTTTMNIIAIDPGTTHSAVIGRSDKGTMLKTYVENGEVLKYLPLSDCEVVIEMVASYGMPVGKETFETVLWIGRFVQLQKQKQGGVRLVYRKDIKMHLCQSMRAKDANIRQALIDKVGPVGSKKKPGPLYGVSSHLWSALAVAIYAQECPDGGERL